MAKIAEARKTVEQLKLEVNIDRMKVRISGSFLPPLMNMRAGTLPVSLVNMKQSARCNGHTASKGSSMCCGLQ